MRFELHLNMDGAAFNDDRAQHGSRRELAELLEEAAARALGGLLELESPFRLQDVNGNRVGYALVTAYDGGCGDPDCTCPECPDGQKNDVS